MLKLRTVTSRLFSRDIINRCFGIDWGLEGANLERWRTARSISGGFFALRRGLEQVEEPGSVAVTVHEEEGEEESMLALGVKEGME